MECLLDTNAVIALLHDPRSPLAHRVRQRRPAEIAISAIVLHELYFGAFRSQRVSHNLAVVEALRFPALELGVEDAREAGAVRAILADLGTPIGPFDALIPGQARARPAARHAQHARVRARARPARRELGGRLIRRDTPARDDGLPSFEPQEEPPCRAPLTPRP